MIRLCHQAGDKACSNQGSSRQRRCRASQPAAAEQRRGCMRSDDVGQGSMVNGTMGNAMPHRLGCPVPCKVTERPCDSAERCLWEGVTGS